MNDYALKVFHEGELLPVETVTVSAAADVTDTIPMLLKKHAGCHRIHVYAGHALLFSVDCNGDTVRG